MDDPDFTEKTPRDLLDSEDSTSSGDDLPITVTPPKRASEIPPLPPIRAARGTRTSIAALPLPNGSRRKATLPPPIPTAARADGSRTGIKIPPGRSSASIAIPPPLPSERSNGSIKLPPIDISASEAPPQLFTTTSAPAKLVPFLPPDDDDPVAAPPAPSVIVAPPLALAQTMPAAPPPPRVQLPTVLGDEHLPDDDFDISADALGGGEPADETEYFDRSAPPKQRNVAAITGVVVGGLFVATLLTLGLRGSGSEKPATPPPAAPTAKFEPPPPLPEAPTPKAAPAPASLPSPATPSVAAAAPATQTAAIPANGTAALATTATATAAPVAAEPAPVASPSPSAPPAPVAVAAAVPATAPSAEAAPAAAAEATIDVPVTSQPAGATVTLIADGDANVLGKTPLIATLETTRTYDIVLAVKDRAPRVIHFDPSKQHEVAVALGTGERAEKSEKADKRSDKTAIASTSRPAPVETPRPRARTTTTTSDAPRAAKKTVAVAEPAEKKQAAPAAATGSGVLMVSSKPPCDIFVDGKRTGLVTPQRSLALPPGVHAITLTNKSQQISKTISVKIVAKQPTKLIQDFTKR